MDGPWLAGLEERARAALPAEVFEYVAQGARDSVTAGEAASAWSDVRLVPRVLRDVTTVDLTTDALGATTSAPWGIAPTTLQHLVHVDGELAIARATAAAGGLMVVSSNAARPFAEIAGTGVRWWLQAYLPPDRSQAGPMLERAVRSGAQAIVLTVDTPVVGTKYAAGERVVWDLVDPGRIRVNLEGAHETAPGAAKAMDLAPEDVVRLREATGLPVVVKGLMRTDDVAPCLEAGGAAIWVSNHGGRQLDRVASTAACLPLVVAEVAGRVPVYVDGGVRSGLDVTTALALGADRVFLGRLALWALVEGERGVERLHSELAAEVVEALRLAGCARPLDARGIALPGRLPPG